MNIPARLGRILINCREDKNAPMTFQQYAKLKREGAVEMFRGRIVLTVVGVKWCDENKIRLEKAK